MKDPFRSLVEHTLGIGRAVQPVLPGLYEGATDWNPTESEGEETLRAGPAEVPPAQAEAPTEARPVAVPPTLAPPGREASAASSPPGEVAAPARGRPPMDVASPALLSRPPESGPSLAPASPSIVPNEQATAAREAPAPREVRLDAVPPTMGDPGQPPAPAPVWARAAEARADGPREAESRAAARRAEPGPRVEIHIGKIEIRPAAPAARPARGGRAPEARATTTSLSDVLSGNRRQA